MICKNSSDIESNCEKSKKLGKLCDSRKDKVIKVLQERFCYFPFLMILCLYTVLYKSHISIIEITITTLFSLLTSNLGQKIRCGNQKVKSCQLAVIKILGP